MNSGYPASKLDKQGHLPPIEATGLRTLFGVELRCMGMNLFGNIFRGRGHAHDSAAHDDGAIDDPMADFGDLASLMRDQLMTPADAETATRHLEQMSAVIGSTGPMVVEPPTNAAATVAQEEAHMRNLLKGPRWARVLVIAGVLVTLSTAMAFAGVLPGPVQALADDAASAIGVDLSGDLDDAADEAADAADEAADAADQAADDAADAAEDAADALEDAADEAADGLDDDADDTASESDDLVGEQEDEDGDDQGDDDDCDNSGHGSPCDDDGDVDDGDNDGDNDDAGDGDNDDGDGDGDNDDADDGDDESDGSSGSGGGDNSGGELDD